ncbi:toll-like receptor 6 [Megalops cyprinoides]|uniref:toll-like receptor 6 n=1 Tax=Megalops cyprinoides TaxID=118141 RepID=UPI00186551FE|nr:toll-like receptor 6 [Megalops cyprinoides]
MVVKNEDEGLENCITFRKRQSDLSHHNLTNVPSNLPEDTQYLDLSYNSIYMLNHDDMAGLLHLCFLKLTHNRLQYISPSAFLNNTRIKVLNISYNSLKTIPDLILPQLSVLDISSNLYDHYSLGSSFKNLQYLSSLSLGSPNAVVVNVDDFASLRNTSLKRLTLGDGTPLQSYESGSLAQLKSLHVVTLRLSFCQRSDMFKTILMDLDQAGAKKVRLVKFLPHFCNVSSDPFEGLKEMQSLNNITFVDTWMNSSVMVKVLKYIFQSQTQQLAFVNITYNEDTPDGVQFSGLPGYNHTVSIRSVIFDQVLHYQYSYPKINISVTDLNHMVYLKFSGTGMNISPCNLISAMPSLEILDLSDNLLNDNGFWWPSCSYTKVFPSLRQLSLSHNRFVDLAFISRKTQEMEALESLDLSFNSIMLRDKCSWRPHLTELNLSNNNLGDTVFQYLSPHFQKISLSKTGITTVTGEVLLNFPNLTHLFLSSNSIHVLPDDLRVPTLLVLHVDQNSITSIGQSSLTGLPGLRELKASRNPFSCSCDSYWFVTALNKSLLPDWPLDYTCSTPPSFAGEPLEEYKPDKLSCHPWLQASIAVPVVVVIAAVLGITFYACDGVWYTRMLWVWIRVKRRGYQEANRQQEASLQYHAFISYSQHDSTWVDAQLVPNLEGAGLSLCIHERDFVPGEWILDNIINCVEGSYKTLFVLSQNFVQSEWCNYELFFAQHRSISIRQDALVFVLLEPIPVDSLPRKFLKLRTLLRQQTYLQWPKEERKKQVFWASLKAMLRTADKSMILKEVATDIVDAFPLLAHGD